VAPPTQYLALNHDREAVIRHCFPCGGILGTDSYDVGQIDLQSY